MSERRRLDQLLVERGLASTRTRAKDLIESGQVFLRESSGHKKLQKASLEMNLSADIFVAEGEVDRYVSRAGLKLEGALREAGLNPQGLTVLDVGQSTGGFTDCLLQQGAEKVIGIDVGHGQLNAALRKHPRVVFFEGINARDMHQHPDLREALPPAGPDWMVMDVSFISQKLLVPALSALAHSGTRLISLVKPQFEVGPEGLGKGGVVRDSLLPAQALGTLKSTYAEAGWTVDAEFESSLEGKDGNKEYFLVLRKL